MKTKHKHWFALTASTLGLAGLSLASGFGDEKYTYDASGNVKERQIGNQVTRFDYTGNQLNGSTSDSTRKQYAYDSSGRITSDSEAGKLTRNLVHEYLDKVTKVQNGDKITELFYNAEGQLVATNSAGTSETFAWDGLAVVNRGEKLYVNETHAVGGVPVIVSNEVAVSDMIGTSLSVGEASFQSTAFGQGLADGLFTGKPFVKVLDGFLFNYRNYSAENARWASVDPSGFPDGINQFCYALSNPVTNVDPLGLWTLHAGLGSSTGTHGSNSPTQPASNGWYTGDNKTLWAKEWVANAWEITQQQPEGPYNTAWTGTISAGASTTTTLSLGVQEAPVTITASVSGTVNTGISQSSTFAAVVNTKYQMRGAVKKGTVTQYRSKFIWHTNDYWWVDPNYGTGGVDKSVINTDVKVPSMVGFQVWKETES